MKPKIIKNVNDVDGDIELSKVYGTNLRMEQGPDVIYVSPNQALELARELLKFYSKAQVK